jgi:AcrR family transcriptional regulator
MLAKVPPLGWPAGRPLGINWPPASVEGIALATRNVYGDNMMDEDNSVNIESDGAKAAGAYHHGDLRAAVIAAGLKRLEAGDDGELGLRALARDVGVSATALYRHFPDKEALLDALADEGLRRLGARQAQAWLKAGGGRNGFKATGSTYVRFAHDEPALFRLSFTRQMSERHAKGQGDGGEVAYNLLRAGVGEALPGVANPDTAALHAWALVHGLAMLILDRRLEWDEAMVDEVVGLTFGGID